MRTSPIAVVQHRSPAIYAIKWSCALRLAHAAVDGMIQEPMMCVLSLCLAMFAAGPPSQAEPDAASSGLESPRIETHDGAEFVVVPARLIAPEGAVVTYRVLVERKHALLADEFAAAVDDALADASGWAAAGTRLVPVVEDADVTIFLAAPKTVDRMCAPLQTGGAFSCGRHGRVVINTKRFVQGSTTYRGRLAEYRTYVINHEVGHVLGLGHRGCPGRGAPAPVMLQQTKSLSGCRRSSTPGAGELAALAARPARYLVSRGPVASGPVTAFVADDVVARAREGRSPARSLP